MTNTAIANYITLTGNQSLLTVMNAGQNLSPTQQKRKKPMSKDLRLDILKDAIDLTEGDRNDAHGDPMVNHTRIAMIWSGILGQKVSASQVAMCMAGLKLARAAYNPTILDSYIDGAAYFAIAGEVAHLESQR
jgi:hypothetical protein